MLHAEHGSVGRSKDLRSLTTSLRPELSNPATALPLNFLLYETINVFILATFRGVFLFLAAKNLITDTEAISSMRN